MANIVTLHKRQLFLAAGTVARYARVSFRVNHTTTQIAVFSDPSCEPEFERSQPVICDVYGVLPVCYLSSVTAIRILATDENDVPLPGYGDGGMDDITPEPTDASGADTTSFNPTAAVPATTVQAAIEYVAGQIPEAEEAQTIVWTTGGTGNAYTLTPTPAIIGYAAGQSYWIRPDRVNTGAVTININGLGTRAIQKTGTDGNPTALVANELSAYTEVYIAYDGAVFRILSSRTSGTSGVDVVNGEWWLNNGHLTCTKSQFELSYNTPLEMVGTWTYPHVFVGPPRHIGCTLTCGLSPNQDITGIDASLANVFVNQLCAPVIEKRSATSVVVHIFKVAGGSSFISGDKLWVTLDAQGPGA